MLTPSSFRSSLQNLQSEALEEFLSILRPGAFFPPSSPILRARRNGGSLPYQFKARVLHSRGDSISVLEGLDRDTSYSPNRSPEFTLERAESRAADHDSDAFRWFAASALCMSTLDYYWIATEMHAIASPVSRIHTRNPFATGLLRNGQLTPSPVSPRAVPLPSPSPEEMDDDM